MIVKCTAFDEVSIQDITSWNTQIVGYVDRGHGKEALKCLDIMQHEGFAPNSITYACILKACGSTKLLRKGQQMHARIIKEGFLKKNVFVGNALVGMYAKCGELIKAQEVFDVLTIWDVASWNTLIGGYAQHGYGDEALDSFEQMKAGGISPNAITFVCILKACGIVGDIAKGQEIHVDIVSKGLLGEDTMVGNALIDMYAKCGVVLKAQEVFDKLPIRDTVSWNALIAGYVQHGHMKKAIECSEEMEKSGFSPNMVTFGCLLKICGTIGAIKNGQEIHGEIIKEGLLGKSISLCNALVEMYAKCGALSEARDVFDQISVKDVLLWTALISGYAQHGHGEEPLALYEKMQDEGLAPTPLTFVCMLKACGNIGTCNKGEEIHARIITEGMLQGDIRIGTSLVDMYAKCGELAKAQYLFNELPVRDVVSWSALIAGFAQLGKDSKALFNAFKQMLEEGIEPNSASFSSMLKMCCHFGLLDKGKLVFEIMIKWYAIIPTLDHYTCLVDLFCRAGLFEKAVGVTERMPFNGDLIMWRALLGACRTWENVTAARLAFKHATLLDETDVATYISMSNIYAEFKEP